MAFKAVRKFELVSDKFREYPDKKIDLPKRTTKSSAGYDISTPVAFTLKPGERIVIKTDIKAGMYDDEMLLIIPRSSVGIKKSCVLPNTIGLIDADYYGNEYNDGNIHIALQNIGDTTVEFEAGERVCQGVFVKYLATENEPRILKKRKGGIGSTGKGGVKNTANSHKQNKENTNSHGVAQVGNKVTQNMKNSKANGNIKTTHKNQQKNLNTESSNKKQTNKSNVDSSKKKYIASDFYRAKYETFADKEKQAEYDKKKAEQLRKQNEVAQVKKEENKTSKEKATNTYAKKTYVLNSNKMKSAKIKK